MLASHFEDGPVKDVNADGAAGDGQQQGDGGDWDFYPLGDEVEVLVPLNDSAQDFQPHALAGLLDDPGPEPQQRAVPTLKRGDVRAGALLGRGRFSEVLEVRNVHFPTTDDDVADDSAADEKATPASARDNDSEAEYLAIEMPPGGGSNVIPSKSLSSFGGGEGEGAGTATATANYSYALKVLREGIDAEDSEAALTGAAYLEIEAEILSALGSHPNIVRLFGIGEDALKRKEEGGGRKDEAVLLSGAARPEGYFLVLERLQKSTLEDRIGEWREAEKPYRKGIKSLKSPAACRVECRKLLLKRLADVAVDVARGVEYLQSQGVAHRDIKPENIGYAEDGTAKIFDFGFARQFRGFRGCDFDEDRPTAMIGTLLYMAPEVAKGKHYGLDVDVYSFGILLWELCALERPYRGYDYQDLHDRVIWGTVRPKPDPSWPQPLRELMMKCWSHFPSDRPPVDEVLEKLSFLVESPDSESGGGGSLTKKSSLKRITSLGSLSAISKGKSSWNLKKDSSTGSRMGRQSRRGSLKKSTGSMRRTLSGMF